MVIKGYYHYGGRTNKYRKGKRPLSVEKYSSAGRKHSRFHHTQGRTRNAKLHLTRNKEGRHVVGNKNQLSKCCIDYPCFKTMQSNSTFMVKNAVQHFSTIVCDPTLYFGTVIGRGVKGPLISQLPGQPKDSRYGPNLKLSLRLGPVEFIRDTHAPD